MTKIEIMNKEITRDSMGGETITYETDKEIYVSYMAKGSSELSENKQFKNLSDTIVFFSNLKVNMNPEQVILYDNKYYKLVEESKIFRRYCYVCEVIL
jgi:hypothetical protein